MDGKIITELAAGCGFMLFGGIMLRQLFKRVDKLDDKKVDKEQFETICDHIKEDLNHGSERFVKIEESLDKATSVLSTQETNIAVIMERVKYLAKQNGFKEND